MQLTRSSGSTSLATSSCRTARPLGFTLVELLAVIAIIGLLAAIMFPVIGKMRKTAQGAQCMGNLRTLFTAVTFHTNEWKRYPTMNCEYPTNPALSGSPQSGGSGLHPWFTTLIEQGYVPVQKETRDGAEIRVAKSLICPANDYQGKLYEFIAAPKPWGSNYMTSRYYGAAGYSAKPVRPLEVTNASAILLVDAYAHTANDSPTGVWNDGDADWNNTKCRVPKDLHGAGAHALFVNGRVALISPATHPDLQNERNWNPRFGN
jgi:prepilin-type N-terminal cleavage/methylation domain-containing protein